MNEKRKHDRGGASVALVLLALWMAVGVAQWGFGADPWTSTPVPAQPAAGPGDCCQTKYVDVSVIIPTPVGPRVESMRVYTYGDRYRVEVQPVTDCDLADDQADQVGKGDQ